jgi:hypothetical protein
VRYNESLRLLRRTAHQHTVREYHNRQVNRLLETRELWAGLPASATLQERLEALKQHRHAVEEERKRFREEAAACELHE